jgi:hypothetical protein
VGERLKPHKNKLKMLPQTQKQTAPSLGFKTSKEKKR